MKNNTKNYRDFIRQCQIAKFQFAKKIISDRNLKRELYIEFLQTEQIADFSLFLQKYYTIYEINRGLHEKENTINRGVSHLDEIFKEYKDLLGKESLPKSYYSHQLEKTETVKTLIEIEKEIYKIKNWIIEEKKDSTEMEVKAEGFSIKLKIWLDKIENPTLKNEIVTAIIKDEENIIADIHDWSKNSIEGIKRYHDFKDYINIHLLKLKELERDIKVQKIDAEKLEKELNFFISLKWNFDLFTKTKAYFKQSSDDLKIKEESVKDGITKDIILNDFTLKFLNNTFNILQGVMLFEDKPQKCVSWVKGFLKKFEKTLAEFVKTIVIECLEDEHRFENKSNQILFIIAELKHYDCSNLPYEQSVTCGIFEYFTGINAYSDNEKLIKSFVKVRGLLKSRKDEIIDFIKENRNEIFLQLQNDIELSKFFYNENQHNSIKDFINSDFGERLLKQIDKYNLQKKVAIETKASKINMDFLNNFYEELEKRNEVLEDKVDIDWFIEHLSIIKIQTSFENVGRAEELINDFQKLNIEVPKFIINYYEEVKVRNNYLNSLFEKESYNWKQDEILKYKSFLHEETNPAILDKESQLEILSTFYKDGKKLIRAINEEIESKYSVLLNSFYNNLTFIASKEEVNYLFWCGGANSFFNIYQTLNKYINTKNELRVIENRIAEIKSVSDKQPAAPESPNIETTKDKNNIISPQKGAEGNQNVNKPQGNEINFLSDYHAKTYDLLGDYFVNTNDKNLLSELINGHAIDSKINCNSYANKFCNDIWVLIEIGVLINEKSIVSEWIQKYFKFKNKDISFSTIERCFQAKLKVNNDIKNVSLRNKFSKEIETTIINNK